MSLMPSGSGDVGLLEVDPTAGTQVSFTPLGLGYSDVALIGQASADFMFPEHAVLTGNIPRFVPLTVPSTTEHEYQLALLDMQERRIVKRGPSAPERLFTEIHQYGDAFYVQSSEAGRRGVLGRIDGKTGALVAAVTLPPVETLKPMHVRDGRVWLYRSTWLSELPYAVLDGDTLAVVASSGGMKAEDVLAKTRGAWLGE